MTRLGPWTLALALLFLFLIHERWAPPPDLPSRPRTEAASAPLAPLPGQSPMARGSLGSPPDHPLPFGVLSDDRTDVDENGHLRDDGDLKSFLQVGPREARSGLDGTIRVALPSARAKWFYRAWGQP